MPGFFMIGHFYKVNFLGTRHQDYSPTFLRRTLVLMPPYATSQY